MKSFTQKLGLVAAIAASAVAVPTEMVKRAGPTDIDILNYALTLEHLEDYFYRTGLSNYTEAMFTKAGYTTKFYNNLKEVSVDEQTHVAFLTKAVTAAGGKPVAQCNYAFPVTDVNSFLGVASVLEGVGISAYLGAAASIMSKDYLTAAGSILTVESRHSAIIRNVLNESPFPSPFDVPLDFDEVYTLAAPFITSCPASNPALPVKAFPKLTLKTTGTIKPGQTVTVASGVNLKQAQVYAAFVTVTGPVWVKATVSADGNSVSVVIPDNQLVAGQSYLVLTSCSTEVSDDYTIAGPAIIEITR